MKKNGLENLRKEEKDWAREGRRGEVEGYAKIREEEKESKDNLED
jgi:hypothetical protein